MIKKLFIFILLTFSLLAQKNLYVNASIGSDATTYANNSSSTPWATITRAVYGSSNRSTPNAGEAASAGDTVFVIAGTYTTTGTDSRWGVAYQAVNDGTAANPIVFYAQGTVDLWYSGGTGPVIGSSTTDYIHWVGFSIDEANALSHADTGPVVLSSNVIGCAIKLCTIDGNGDPGFGDNHNGIRIEAASYCLVQNNTIHDVYTSGVNGANGAGIMMYESDNNVMEHNEIYNVGSGIFIKGPAGVRSQDDTIRYNYIYNASSAGIILASAEDNIVYQNLVIDSNEGFRLWELGTTATPTSCDIYNNTFYNMSTAGINIRVVTVIANMLYNNIVVDAPYIYYSEQTVSPSPLSINYGCYDTYSSAFAQLTGGNQTLAQWQSNYFLDANSVDDDPLFVNVGADSFQLQSGSPAEGTGQGSINMGAYITGLEQIGLGETVSGTPEPPATPSVTTKINYKERP